NLFDFTLRLKGFPIREARSHLNDIQQLSDDAFLEYIEKHKQKIIQYHSQNNSFYAELTKGVNTENWLSIPVLKKSDLQQPLVKRLSNEFSKKNVYINKTSGSGGHPFIFAKDKFCHALTWAVIQNRFAWHGIDLKKSFQARFYGIPLNFVGYQKERFKDLLSNRYRFPIFDLSEEMLEQFYQKFTKMSFEYINGYTSSIVLFAKHLQHKNVILKDVCPSLKVCMVTSEMLFERDKKLLEYWLGVPIVNEYGASELDLIAYTDAQNDFVVNAETLFVEILDENNHPVALGEQGRIVITSLYNKAHPFIRYDIGDWGSFSKAGTARKPILKSLIGRTNDIAILPNGKKVPGLTFYYVTKKIIEEESNVTEFVVVQIKKNSFEIKYTSRIPLNDKEEKAIRKALETYIGSGLNLNIKRVEILKRNRRGKLKQFTTLVNE
ncbi:phenylacetate--CoA ligase family protein, partial [uncultured Planktosalinus sp.]|uniref:phenylacetate--CoA ligase family protein n=1 Tax=uncultured Planktosalinus sp. TaxID=1810935 RepID=UPI0030D82D87